MRTSGSRTSAEARMLIQGMFESAVAASNPEAAVERHLQRDGDAIILNRKKWPVTGRIVVVGAGKAAVAMARAVERICGDLLDSGLVITKDGHAAPPLPDRIEVVEAAHPIPDQRGAEATQRILEAVGDLNSNDLVLALISGGGSALLEAPIDGVSLDDTARITDTLLRAGAPIQDLNTVRRPLSRVKGGGLLRAAGKAPVLSLILSDVLGNDPHIIASGPTVPSPTIGKDALAVIDRYGLSNQVSAVVRDILERQEQRGFFSDPGEEGMYAIVADNQTAVDAAVHAARSNAKRVEIAWREKEGEASDLGRTWVRLCGDAAEDVDILIGGGEATVTVRGDGVGGRNIEFALAAALELASAPDSAWVVASLATDGQDGPTGAAGAIADSETIYRAREAGIDPVQALAENDSMRVFEAAGGLISPGPTGTNVNDLYIAVRVGES